VIVQLYYGNRDIHYEAWHRAKLRTVEIGLHFESDDLTNARLLGAFRSHARTIHRALPNARLEVWDRGWTRIWEPIAAEGLDERLRADLADRIARYITALEPMLREELPAGVPWSLPAPARQRRSRPARVMARSGASRMRSSSSRPR
jgi:hypothetical protein